MDRIQGVVLDMDGVMRLGMKRIEGINELIAKIQSRGIPAMVLTNECRYTEEKIRSDFQEMEINWPAEWKIYSSAMAVRDFLIRQINKPNLFQSDPKEETHYYIGVVGEEGLVQAIKKVQAIIPECPITFTDEPPENDDNSILFLIMGTVFQLEIKDLEKSMKWMKQGARIVVTCPDVMDPELKEDFSICMPRHILHMVRLNVDNSNYFSVGKPSAFMANQIRKNFDWINNPSEILFIGDSLNTDITLTEENGFSSALVLTGNTQIEDLRKSIIQPDIIVKDLLELAEAL